MKTKNLLPNRWKPIGWVLLVLGLSILLWGSITERNPTLQLEVTMRWPFGGEPSDASIVPGLLRHNQDGTITLDLLSLVDELYSLLILAGLFMVGFARVKNEDERTAQMRLEALQWAIYGNTLILVLCIIFVYGLDFLTVMMFNMFTPLLIFVLRFHWLLYCESQEMKTLKARREAV